MTIARRDDTVQDAQGRALAGALVYYCTQPASTGSVPPSPLATVYTDITGDIGVNPVITDGFGHAVAYLTAGVLYTIVYSHPLFGAYAQVYTDQQVSSPSNGIAYTPFSGVPSGTINGVNRVFTLTNNGVAIPNVTPAQVTVRHNGISQTPGLGVIISGNQVTFSFAPQTGDDIYASGLY